jgi:hypothetical protein
MDSIAHDVIRALESKNFFNLLDRIVFPSRELDISTCDHTHNKTIALLVDLGFSEEERNDIIGVLESRGGYCDCEVLLNAADGDDLPKERYWKERAKRSKGTE